MRASWRMNKTDRELLEAAAKAAGLHFHGLRVGLDYTNCYVSKTGDAEDWFVWSPLTDDGDALRLAVAIGMKPERCFQVIIDGDFERTGVRHTDRGGKYDSLEEHVKDPYAATRRAIVRAAAAIADDN